jgi:monovalent cation/hydrogen antiporter
MITVFAFLQLTIRIARDAEQPSMHTLITLILSLLIGMIALAISAPRLKIPYPILLVLAGLFLGFVPGLPGFTLNPDLIFLLFLPLLLYADAWFTSWRDFLANLRPISLLAIGLVLLTTIVVAVVAHALVPGFSWAAAFVLGAVISPTDSVAAASIAQRLGLPRRILTILEGESLVNDASGLVVYQFAVIAVVTGTFSLTNAILQFVIVSSGGILVGLIVGWCLTFVHRALDNPTLETIITLLTPFVAYLLADAAHVSAVLATVTTGLYLTLRAPVLFSAQTRQQTLAVWTSLVFLLNGLIFIFIGLQLRGILDTLASTITHRTVLTLIWYGIGVSGATILVRLFWMIPSTYLPRLLSRRLRQRDPAPGWRYIALVGWTGMRGVVSLAAAFALPTVMQNGAPFEDRALILYLTFCVILVTLVLQGLSLPLLIRWLGLKDNGAGKREELEARKITTEAALVRINELVEQDAVPNEAAEHLRTHYEARLKSIIEAANGEGHEQDEGHLGAYQSLQQEALHAEHFAVIHLRNQGRISEEVFHLIEREIDLDKQRLQG